MNTYNFLNKVVLVTGSSRGIGKAIALEFAKAGAVVIINHPGNKVYSDDVEQGEITLKQIESLGSTGIIIQCDVSNESQVLQMRDEILSTYGKLDVLVNNAGIVYDTSFLEKTVGEWQNTLNTDLVAPFITAKAFYELLSNGGSIISISSTNGLHAFSEFSADYDASKSGLIQLTKILAQKFADRGVRVNCVCPGWVNTDMNKDLPDEYVVSESAKIYQKRFAEPVDIAKPVLFLASDDARYMTGSIVVVDGGTR